MALKIFKPVTPSLRHRVIVQKPKSSIKLDKNLIKIKKKNAGRNNTGRITIRHRGSKSDHKRFLRIIDRARTLGQYSKCLVLDIQYDPNISGFIALLEPIIDNNIVGKSSYSTPCRFYILAPSDMKKGAIIEGEKHIKLDKFLKSNSNLESYEPNIIMTPGINRPLKDLPIGSYIYNLNPNNQATPYLKDITGGLGKEESGKYARAAGTYCILLKTYNKNVEIEQTHSNFNLLNNNLLGSELKGKEEKLREDSVSVVRLPSKKILNIPSSSLATLGQVSNIDHNLTIKGKAGANR